MKYSIVLLLLFCIACKKNNPNNGDTAPAPAPAPQLYSYTAIKPSTTTTGITGYDNEHAVYYDTRVTSKNKLVVYLPGTSATPSGYTELLKASAAMGYHTLGLMYPNGSELYSLALFSTDLTVMGRCRQEAFDGTDQIAGLTIDNANCIKTRLVKLLTYLNTSYPLQNWAQYLNGTTDVQWSKVIIAGHSQGGGHAFYIAKKVGVYRTIAFASIDYNTNLNQNASWVTQPGVTPITSYYSINHTADEVFAYANVQIQLAAMGLTGPAINTETATTPYSNSRTLTTTAIPAITAFGNHSVTCIDSYLPRDASNNPKATLVKAWEYLLEK